MPADGTCKPRSVSSLGRRESTASPSISSIFEVEKKKRSATLLGLASGDGTVNDQVRDAEEATQKRP